MDSDKERKRKKEKRRDGGESRDKNDSKRIRSRSRSPREKRDNESRRKRRHSRSQSPVIQPKQDKKLDGPQRDAEVKKEGSERKNKETDMLNTRTGGAYIPPARLRMMQAQITDKSSAAYQRLAWEALKKSIHGHINKINVGNIGIIIKELLKENIVRGRGLLCRSIIQAQAASPTFTNVYAALVAAVNSRFPNIGELLLKRLVIQFKRGFKRNDKPICISSASFVAHLVNQRVAHEILALELLTLLVETPTNDSVEVAIAFLKECGQKLTEVSSKGVNAIFEMLRNILHEGQLEKRVQYMIEVMFQVWKDGFKDHPALIEELDVVPEEEQFTHLLMLDEATDPQDILNVFKLDEKYEENEQKYKNLCKEILGSDAESGEEGSGSEEGSDESDDEEGGDDEEKKGDVTIIDNTETNLIALRRTIYLTINSSLDFEECAHKLMKMQLKPGQEVELCHMFLDCCAEQRTYEKFYGLLAQRFCNINRIYIGPFEDIFKDSYSTAHRLDTNRLRNVSKFFAHLLFTDSISWEVLECVKLNEEDTTSSSRIYIKILFQELAEYMGLKKLNDRLKDQTLQGAFSGIFPRDNPKNTRFSINFFTSIGLGGLTDELREHLKQMPKNIPPPEIKVADTSSDSSSSSSDSSSSSSDSEEEEEEEEEDRRKKKEKSKKKKKDKSGAKTPEAVEVDKPVERWGHDGFYSTYGRDADRPEPRRDKDNFVMPNVPRPRPNRDDDRRKNGEDRRNREEGKESDRSRRGRDEDPRERRQTEREDRDDDRRKNGDERRNREEERESADRSRRGRDEDPRERRQTDREDRQRDDDRRKNGDDRRNREEERESDRSRRERDEDPRERRQTEREDRQVDRPRKDTRNDDESGYESRNKSDREKGDSRRHDDESGYESRSKSDREKGDMRRRDDTRSNRKEREEERTSKREERTSKREERTTNREETNKKDRNKNSDKPDSHIEKSKKQDKKSKSKPEKESSSDSSSATSSSSSDSEDDESAKKHKKKSRRNRETDDWDIRRGSSLRREIREQERDREDKDKEVDWDIRRESSLRRETPTTGRYWDNHDAQKSKPKSYSEDRERTSDRRRDR